MTCRKHGFCRHRPSWARSAAWGLWMAVASLACGPSAPAWGGTFRGLGQEPGWLVEIDPEGLHWLGDYGEVEFTTGPPAHQDASGEMVWTASTANHTIRVFALEEICHDVMSGHEFSHSVTVEVDGTTYSGCGRWQEESG